jgi:hypothetical protein
MHKRCKLAILRKKSATVQVIKQETILADQCKPFCCGSLSTLVIARVHFPLSVAAGLFLLPCHALPPHLSTPPLRFQFMKGAPYPKASAVVMV